MLDVRWATPEEAGEFVRPSGVACEQHLAASVLFIGFYDAHRLVAVFGLAPVTLLSTTAYVWLVTAPDLPALAFIRASRKVPGMVFEHFDMGVGYSSRPDTIRWLKWVGCIYGPRCEMGYPWQMRKPNG